MGFSKAVSEQKYLKIAMYGKAGSGKSFTALLLGEALAKREGKRMAYVDTEHGTDFYTMDVPTRQYHPKGFDFDANYSRALGTVVKDLKGLVAADTGVIVVDSMTHLWRAAVDSWQGRRTNGKLPIYAWGPIKQRYGELLEFLINCPMHMILLGRLGLDYDKDEDGQDGVVGYKMKAEAETGHETHMLIRMESIGSTTKKENPEILAYVEKDRTGVLHGKTIVMPSFATLAEPTVHLLTAPKQAQIQTSASASAEDADTYTDQEYDKDIASRKTLAEYSMKLEECKTKEEVQALGKEIKTASDGMIPADVATLRGNYKAAMGQFEAPDPQVARGQLIDCIDKETEGWNPEYRTIFVKEHLYGRDPEYPTGYSLVDLRALKLALEKRDRSKDEIPF